MRLLSIQKITRHSTKIKGLDLRKNVNKSNVQELGLGEPKLNFAKMNLHSFLSSTTSFSWICQNPYEKSFKGLFGLFRKSQKDASRESF